MVQLGDVRPDEVERKLKLGYVYGDRSPTRRLLDDVRNLAGRICSPDVKLEAILQEAADIVHKSLWIREVTIGLRNPADGKYRYAVMSGLRDDAWKAHADLEYTHEQFHNPDEFNSRSISGQTVLFLTEDEPYLEGEDDTFNRPILLKARRRRADECIEGDYLDTHIRNRNGDLIGWVEYSGTKSGEFPDGNAIRWIELIATLLALVIERKAEEGGRARLDSGRRFR